MTEAANPAEKIVTASVLIIGNEILSGRTQDMNLAYIAKGLNEVGVTLREARVIPDIAEIIVATLNELRAKFDYVFTTGGIGPTHDDITLESVARAFGYLGRSIPRPMLCSRNGTRTGRASSTRHGCEWPRRRKARS